MYTLFGSAGSGSAAVEAALDVAGVACRHVSAATWEPGPGLEELLRVNPLGQVPTLLLPDGTVMTESAAILIHLAEAHPASRLLPPSGPPRAAALRGLVYLAANCYPAIGIIDYPERWCGTPDEEIRECIRAGARARLHSLWEVFADAFPAAPFITGLRPGAVDILASVVSRWSGARPHLAKTRPAFHALLLRIDQQPGIAGVMTRHWPPEA